MEKSPDAFRTISEVAEDLDIPQHVLRFWETRFGQIRPLKRGGGRRYYRPDDVDLLKGIRHLLYSEGYTIKGVQRILKEQGIDAVLAQVAALDGLAGAPPPDADEPAPAPHRIEPQLDAITPEPPVFPPLPLAPVREDQPAAPWRAPLAPPPAANEQTPPLQLDPARARLLREALAEIEECRRLLALTRR